MPHGYNIISYDFTTSTTSSLHYQDQTPSLLYSQSQQSFDSHLPLSLSNPLPSKRTVLYEQEIHRRSTQIWKIKATPEEVLPSDTTPLESTQQMLSTINDDGVGNIISVLLFVAFSALSILTIGIIYLGVTDFLQKRETEKLQKEEESKKKKRVKKRKVRARSGPRGFGQKINEDDEFDD